MQTPVHRRNVGGTDAGAWVQHLRQWAWREGALPHWHVATCEERWANCYGLVLLKIGGGLTYEAPLPYLVRLCAG